MPVVVFKFMASHPRLIPSNDSPCFSFCRSVLVAACEKKSIRLFDTISCQQYSQIPDAHADCVNCVKYVRDDRWPWPLTMIRFRNLLN